MGRAAVWVTSTFMLVPAIGILANLGGSRSLERFGGRPVDIAWALALILAWCAFTYAWRAARRGDGESAGIIERAGTILFVTAIAVYALALVLTVSSIANILVILAFCAATITNLLGRTILLWRRVRAILAASREDAESR